jgi:hypothetical protein
MKLKSNLTESQINTLKELGLVEEEQQPKQPKQQPWEKYPDYKSCWNDGDKQYLFNAYGNIHNITVSSQDVTDERLLLVFSSEAHAKRVRAEMMLKRIADKWQEGMKMEKGGFYSIDGDKDIYYYSIYTANKNPIRFITKELARKSLELFPELWDDYLTVV